MSALKPSILNSTKSKVVTENLKLLYNPVKTFLTSDTASASGTLTVKSIVGFSINQVLIIGDLNNEGSEIIKTHSSTAPSGSTITLAANTIYPHSSGTPIYVIDYDQIEISTATTLTGSKTVLATIALQVDDNFTSYTDTANSSGFYFARFKNTITSVFSPYSDGIPVGGYGILTARSLIDNALGSINKLPSNLMTDEYCFNQINNCQLEVLRELKRWSFLQVFEYNLGQLTTGQWKVAVPTNLDDQFTNKSIYNFRIGTLDDLTWVDKAKWDEITQGVAHSTLAVAISLNDATITLSDASDFSDAGTLYIGANTYVYSSINRTTNIATLSTVATTTNLISTDVFQGATLGSPEFWTIFGGNIQFYPVLDSSLNQREGHLDYYIAPVSIVNDSDTIVIPDPTVVQYYLTWKLLLRQQNGLADATTDSWKANYEQRKLNLKQKEVLGRTFKLKPILNSLDESSEIDGRNIRGGSFPNTGF